MTHNCLKYYQDPTNLQRGVLTQTRIWVLLCALWPWPWIYDLGARSWHTLGSWITIVWNIIQIHLGSEELWPGQIFSMCVLWPWPQRYDLGSRSWHILGSWTTILWNINQIQLGSQGLWPGHGFWVCVHCDLDLSDMTLGQGHDTPLGHGQQLCHILSKSDKWVGSYGLDTMWTADRQQTDSQTDGHSGDYYYTPQTLFAGGGGGVLIKKYTLTECSFEYF